MPTLVLSSRYSEDSIALWRAAIGYKKAKIFILTDL